MNRRKLIEQVAKSALGLTVLPTFARANDTGDGTIPGFGSAKRIIFINVAGGMSHIDTFDPKEGKSKGPTKTIKTKADFQVTNFLPETAKIADKISLIRTMTAKIGVHGPAQYFVRTAFAERNTIKHPNLGAWAQHFLGESHETLPSSACINQGSRYGNGFFPPSYSPIPIMNPETGLDNIKSSIGADGLKGQLDLAGDLSADFLSRFNDANVNAYREFYDHTIRLLRSEDLSAFDLTKEKNATRDAYGRDNFGQGCLLARRLVEAGIRYVEVTSEGWDFHKNLASSMEDVVTPFDQSYAALINDLDQRGLLDSTLVVLATEFGRKPEYKGDGRGHYPTCFTMGLAGAGVKRGFVYGESDNRGAQPDKPVSIEDFHATVAHAAGLPRKEFTTPIGRPFMVGGEKAKIVGEMFA